MAKEKVSKQTQDEAMAMAKATQRPGQDKEQTKLIAKGIEKGIAEYKKRQKAKSRELNKKKKRLDQQLDTLQSEDSQVEQELKIQDSRKQPAVIWLLLGLSILLNILQAINII